MSDAARDRFALAALAFVAGARLATGCGDATTPLAAAPDGAAAELPDAGAAPEAAPAGVDPGTLPSADAGDAMPATVAVCDVRAYGAKGDAKTKDTVAIQKAIDACAVTGGTVVLKGGTFLSGMVQLKSNIALAVDTTATLLGSQDDADYPDTHPPTLNTQLRNCKKALIYAESAENVRIFGGGTINGNGNTPKWIGPSTVHPEGTRPMAIFTALSKNVTVQDVTVKDAARWGVVNLEADHLTIRNVTIDSRLSGNRDGIDVVDCHHVLIENCTIASEDDAICIKSGSRRGVDDVMVKNTHVVRSIVANALKFGTASYGSFTNVTFDTVTIDSADKAAMAVESVDGADISNIVFRNITFKDVGTPVFILLGDRGETPANDAHKIGSIDGVRFEHVTGTHMRYNWSSPVSGTTLPDGTIRRLTNLLFMDVHIANKGGLTAIPRDPPEYAGQYPDPNLWGNLPAFGYFLRHVDGVTFTNSTSTVSPGDVRKSIEQRDVSNLTLL